MKLILFGINFIDFGINTLFNNRDEFLFRNSSRLDGKKGRNKKT